MSSPLEMEGPQEVANRVLRRAQVSKMARALQDRLALANVKIKHGWQNRSIESIEPEIEREMKRLRTDANNDVLSDTSSNVSARCFSSGAPISSPLTAPVFSDEVRRSGSSSGSSKRYRDGTTIGRPASGDRNVGRPANSTSTWKSNFQLPESSPIKYHNRPRPTLDTHQQESFASESSTILNSPSVSEDDDQDLPLQRSDGANAQMSSSPPRTPAPSARKTRLHTPTLSSPADDSATAGKEGADLLLYLAASPSPAVRRKDEFFAPSTPPTKSTPLPSSMMSTPGFFSAAWNPTTPSTAFNFSDFVNVTPSPAQLPWARTPAKTPRAALEARRRLNYDGLLPTTSGSPSVGSSKESSSKKGAGLGMELGGELVNS